MIKIDLTTAEKVKKFTHKSAGSIEDHMYIWSTLLDSKIGPALQKKYFTILKSDGIANANRIVYKELSNEFNRKLTQDKSSLYKSLSDGLIQLSNKNDKIVDFPSNLSKKETNIFKFNNLEICLQLTNISLKAVYVENSQKPCIKFSDAKTGKPLVSLCMKIDQDNNYIAHYIDKGKLIDILQPIVGA